MRKILIVHLLICFFLIDSFAQDTLPNFIAVKKREGIDILKWVNDYGVIKQITIQRSTDSLVHFASLNTYSNAMNKFGEFVDKKAKFQYYFYRLYIQLPEGKYFYTKSKKTIPIQKFVPRNLQDSIMIGIISKNNKDINASNFIFTDKKNNVILTLPEAENENYRIDFYDEMGKIVLKIPKVFESSLILEKYNFYKSGWYFFEIYLDNKLLERNKIFIGKEDIK